MKRLLLLVGIAVALSCGKVVFTTERFACNSSGECADGFVCAGGECVASGGSDAGTGGGGVTGGGSATGGGGATGGGAMGGGGATGGGGGRGPGVACTSTTQCNSGLTCTDGVCCTSVCGDECDSCNQSSSPGTCLPSPAGTSAACAGYACDGASTVCPTMCSGASANECSPGYTCIAPTCGRCWSSVTNSFSVMNDPAWSLNGASTSSGSLSVSIQSRANMSVSASATSNDTLPLTGCGVTFALTVAPSVVTGYSANMVVRGDVGSRRPAFGWRFDTRGMLATWAFTDGGTGEQVVVPAGTAPPGWLRIEEGGGQILWRTTNGTSFNTVHTEPHSESLTGMKLEFNASFPAQSGSDRVSYEIDSLNLGP